MKKLKELTSKYYMWILGALLLLVGFKSCQSCSREQQIEFSQVRIDTLESTVNYKDYQIDKLNDSITYLNLYVGVLKDNSTDLAKDKEETRKLTDKLIQQNQELARKIKK